MAVVTSNGPRAVDHPAVRSLEAAKRDLAQSPLADDRRLEHLVGSLFTRDLGDRPGDDLAVGTIDRYDPFQGLQIIESRFEDPERDPAHHHLIPFFCDDVGLDDHDISWLQRLSRARRLSHRNAKATAAIPPIATPGRGFSQASVLRRSP